MRFNKNYKWGLFLLFLLLLLTTSISFFTFDPKNNNINQNSIFLSAPEDYYEPNNDPSSATDIRFNEANWLGVINGNGTLLDDDWYLIDLDPGEERLKVDLIFNHAAGNIDIEVYDGTYSYITGNYSMDDNEFLELDIFPSGIYYLRIFDNLGVYAGNTYDFYWEDLMPHDDPFEENDDFWNSKWVNPNWYSDLRIINYDEDWFHLYLNPGDTIDVSIYFSHMDGDLELELYDPTYSHRTGDYSSDDNEYITYTADMSGDWRIRVYRVSGVIDVHYDLDIWLMGDDWMEDNDDFYSAWPIEPSYYPDLKIVEYDEDWFRIHLIPDDIIDIRIYFNNFDGDLQLELYDPYDSYNPRDRSESTTADDEHISFTADESGGWRIHVYRVSGDSNVDVWYHLEIWVNGEQAGVDPYEYNDYFDDAYDLRDDEYTWLSDIHGVAVQEYEDWYMIDITPGFRHLMVNLSLTYGFGNIWFSIHDEQGFNIGDSYSVPYGEHIDFILSRPGIYFIKIWGDNTGIKYDLWWDDLRTDTRDDDSYEENDDPLSAYDLSSHQYQDLWRINGTAIQRDNDWYKIFITSGFEHLFVEVKYDYQEGPIGIEIYDGDLSKVTENFTNEDNELISYDLPSNGTYYIRIHGYHSGNIYSLRWETWEPHIEDMIPGYDVVIILGAIFGVAAVLTLKWKRSKKHL